MDGTLEDVVAALAAAERLGVITGAGISAASGIGTYRGRGGLYDDPVEGDRTVEALSGPTFRRDPDRTWRVLARLAEDAGAAHPNAAHEALALLESHYARRGGFVLLTQNVDGLHRRAGSRNIVEIHGHVFDTRCLDCDARRTHAALPDATRGAPRCHDCGGILRPEVVLFEEMLPAEPVARLEREFLEAPPDALLAVGTTALFPYIQAPIKIAATLGLPTVEINPERTDLSPSVRWHLRARAEEILPALVARVVAATTPMEDSP